MSIPNDEKQRSVVVEFYSKDDCHLCDVAKVVILKIRAQYPFEFVEVKIRPGSEEYEKFKERVPVIFVNGEFAFHYKIVEAEFIKKLKGHSSQ